MRTKTKTKTTTKQKQKKAPVERPRLFLLTKGDSMGRPATVLKEKEIPTVISRKIRYENLKVFDPITETQEQLFEEYKRGNNLLLHGFAGTGKTFLALYLSFKEVLLRESKYDKVVVVRSAVPVHDIGFLPGSEEEKTAVYEQPYKRICDELFYQTKAGPIYEQLKEQKLFEFITTSFIRGITLHNSIVIVDEFQDLDGHSLDSIITRLGGDSKIIFCGDKSQSDLHKQSEKEGVSKFMKVLDRINGFSHIEFKEDDIVRSQLVKSYIIEKHKLGIEL